MKNRLLRVLATTLLLLASGVTPAFADGTNPLPCPTGYPCAVPILRDGGMPLPCPTGYPCSIAESRDGGNPLPCPTGYPCR